MKSLFEEYGMSVIAVLGVFTVIMLMKNPILSCDGTFAQWILHWCSAAC